MGSGSLRQLRVVKQHRDDFLLASSGDAAGLLNEGLLTGISIGYDTIKQKFESGVRKLVELKLYEVSLVTFPAHPLAQVTAKSDAEIATKMRAETRTCVEEIRALVMQPRAGSNNAGAMHAMSEQLADICAWARRERRALR